MRRGAPADPDPVAVAASDAAIPLTRAQHLIWTGHALAPDAPVYNMAWRFDFRTSLDPASFAQAFRSVVRRCDTLRTIFEETDGVPRQHMLDGPSGAFQVLNFGDEDAVVRWIAEQARRPFDVSRETFRSALLQRPDGPSTWFLNLHHLVTDASSSEIIFREVARAYEAVRSGQDPPCAPMPSVAEQAKREPGEPDPDAQAYWERRLAQPIALPRLYQRPAGGSATNAHRVVIPLGPERCAKLRGYAGSDDFAALSATQSLFNLLATVLVAWISRVSGQSAPSIGVVTHGRRSLEARRAVGCFVEIFPLQAEIGDGETFRSLHAKVAREGLDLLRHAGPGASSAKAQGRFNVVLNYIPTAFGAFEGAPPDVAWLDTGHTDPGHALRLNVTDFGGRGAIELAFLFNDSVFDADLRARAPRHFLRALDGLLADPDVPIRTLALADPDEASTRLARRAELVTREATPVDDVVASFRRLVGEAPDAVVVQDCAGDTSRAALDARSDAFAQALAEAGAGPGSLVGIHLTRVSDLPAAMLGVLKLGASVVPLDPAQPPGRLDAILREAGLRVVISERQLAGRWAGGETRLLVDDVPAAPHEPFTPVHGDAPAYVMFTSGSTGTPKGVQVGRAALARYARWAHTEFAGGGAAAWALHSAIGFDLTITSLFAPLANGGSIVAYRETLEGPDLSVLRVFEDDAVDVVKLTPAHLSLAVEAGRPVRRIRALVLGGEDLPTQLARRACETLGKHVAIFNEYGPTEATVGCMIHRFDPGADVAPSVPIGVPAAATCIYVLDAGLHPVPDDVVGDLYVAGPDRLAAGYLNRVAETSERFVPDPFRPGSKMYRTGDFASVRPDGVLRFHGRADDQVKIGGVRIELGEIRQAVLAHPDVTDCTLGLWQRTPSETVQCARCGIGSDYPDARIDHTGVCGLCRDYDEYRSRAATYFRDMDGLRRIVARAADRKTGAYDCVMLLSGGKDSTYALCQLAEITPSVLAATLDNGFLSAQAKENIRRVTESLGIEHRFLTTPAMNEIFVDSLNRHANVCNGCFKTIYTLGLKLARDEGAPLIVTGLSRGQMFETRLAPELFDSGKGDVADIDAMVLEARKTYHRFQDVAARRLNGTLFDDDSIFDQVEFVDFYRYCDVPVTEVYAYLRRHVPWVRPADTGRSTNCLINDAGIHVHKTLRGYHNYALPYSWDVRMGHKTRDEARAELEDEIDETRVTAILREIGFDRSLDAPSHGPRIVCHYVAKGDLAPDVLRRFLGRRLPREMTPAHFVPVASIPLTANGKVDRAQLPEPGEDVSQAIRSVTTAPRTSLEKTLWDIWRAVLRRSELGVEDNFYEVGGDSIAAIQIASRAAGAGLNVSAVDVFRHQTIAELAALAGQAPDVPERPRARATLDARSKQRLEELFGRRAHD